VLQHYHGGTMMYRKRIIASLILIFLAIAVVSAAETLTISADYSTPIGNNKIDPNVGVGVIYRFWGIFTFSGTMYTEIINGADNILNVWIRPIGLFSAGLGMKIPLGAFDLTFGWQKFFTGTVSTDGVFPFSDSYKAGAAINLSKSFSVEIFTRGLFAFSEQAVADSSLRIETPEDTVETIGVGLHFHLF
jgi:hypothetical protein